MPRWGRKINCMLEGDIIMTSGLSPTFFFSFRSKGIEVIQHRILLGMN